MKKPMDYVYRFCNKHPNFGIPNLMKYIVGGNVVFWLLSLVNPVLMSYLSFSPTGVRRSSRYFSSPASFSPRYSPSSSTLSPALA